MDPKLARHWAFAPGLTFVNHGSFGATPRVVLEEQAQLRARMEADPIQFLDTELPERFAAAKLAVAGLLGADARDLVFLPNATTGVNVVLRSLQASLRPGDELLTTNQEYNATLNAMAAVARASGASMRIAQVPFPLESPDQVVEAVLAEVTEHTRLAMLSWVTSATAVIFPLERIAAELAARGVEVLVDAAHAPGQVPVDLGALERAGVTYFAANGHKWLCAPKGSAVLWVRRDRQGDVHPLVISHGTNAPFTADGRSRYQLEFDWPGTPDPTAFLCLPSAIAFMGELLPGGWPALMAANHELVLQGREILEERLGLGPGDRLAPDHMLGAMVTLPLPDDLEPRATAASAEADPDISLADDPLHDDLVTRDRVQVPIFAWPARPALGPASRYVRISAQRYNDRSDYERLADALARRRC